MSEEQSQKRDKPMKPGHWVSELGHQSSLEPMLANIGIKFFSACYLK